LLLLACVAGCSTFEPRWKELAAQPAASADRGVLGRWEGAWHSEPSGHEGSLRCIIDLPAKPNAPQPAGSGGAGRYLFRFSATWGLGFVSEYELEMDIVEREGKLHLAGESNLGLFYGDYRCEGHFDGDTLRARYKASVDHGTFELKRLQ
jgi:hypothetical protein